MKSQLNVKVRGNEYVSKVDISGGTCIVQTEDIGIISGEIITMTYQKGAIVSARTTDHNNPAGEGLKEKIKELMHSRHRAVLESLSKKNEVRHKSKAQLANQMNACLRKGNRNAALEVVKEALSIFPEDPFFLSHSGYLVAEVEKRTKEGCSICENSIEIIAKSTSADKEFFYPLAYLNLGRAYLAGRQKKDALDAFYTGLKYDAKHKELLSLIRKLGVRRAPVIRSLGRGNPINKYLGKLRYWLLSS